ncbi:hypothetical protein BGY98DRAFT_179806 [Russula aff. rugulosa BPL654]|nr:hypothetical protein BGY98DRAFT_179806 [Russula aff. rugulosa BPL654]
MRVHAVFLNSHGDFSYLARSSLILLIPFQQFLLAYTSQSPTAQPNNSSTAAQRSSAQRGALGIPLLFATRHLVSHITRNRTAQCATRAMHTRSSTAPGHTAYLHGGNAGRLLESGTLGDYVHGDDALAEQRLDDFWSTSLSRPAREEIVRRGTFRIRCQQFRETCYALQMWTF